MAIRVKCIGRTGSDGSDSDATTTSSTEHLTREEKLYVLRHTARQEPQGQESKSWQQLQQQRQSRPSCRSCSGLQLAQQQQRSGSVNRLEQSLNNSGGGGPDPASSCRTLIIHGSLSDESWARYFACISYPFLFRSTHMCDLKTFIIIKDGVRVTSL